jgi:hypothetical protein
MAKTTKPEYIVVVAEYDESGSDGLNICNAIPFTKPKAAAKFIVEDFGDTMSYAEDMGVEYEELDLERVMTKIESLQKDESHEWNSPADMPRQIKWKVFVK